MGEGSVDLDGTELDAGTAFGRAQGPVLGALCVGAVVCVFGAVVLLAPRTIESIELVPEWREIALTESATGAELQSRRELIREVDRRTFFACRTAQLLDDVQATRLPPALPNGWKRWNPTVNSVLEDVDFGGVSCRPASWLGPGSQLDELPRAIDAQAEVRNPLWASDVEHATPQALAEAELRLWTRLDQEFTLVSAVADPSDVLRMAVPHPEYHTATVPAPLELVLGLVGAALLMLVAVFGLALVPDRQRLRFDLRGITIGTQFIPAERVGGVWMEDGRLLVEEKDGTRHWSARFAYPAAVEPLIAQYQRLSTAQSSKVPAEVRRLMGRARKE